MYNNLQNTPLMSSIVTKTYTQNSPPSVIFTISNPNSMTYFGQYIATLLVNYSFMPVILLYGEVGSGKTTFTRGLVQHFLYNEYAEVSSPSFTICNYYPTNPTVIHCDLYRCSHTIPEEIYELLYDHQGLVIIEWAEYLPEELFPTECIIFSLSLDEKNTRQISCYHHGVISAKIIDSLIQHQQVIQLKLMNTQNLSSPIV